MTSDKENDDRIEQMQLFLWLMPHWAEERRIAYGSIEENARVAVHGVNGKDKNR